METTERKTLKQIVCELTEVNNKKLNQLRYYLKRSLTNTANTNTTIASYGYYCFMDGVVKIYIEHDMIQCVNKLTSVGITVYRDKALQDIEQKNTATPFEIFD